MRQRQAYLGADTRWQTQRLDDRATISAMLATLDREGYGDSLSLPPLRRAQPVLALETATARSHATREVSAEERNADTLWTPADFAREAPGMDWALFLAAAGLPKQRAFVTWPRSALHGTAALVAQQSLQAWKNDAGNLRRVSRHNLSQALGRVGQAADRSAWGIAPQSPAGVLNIQTNAYNSSATLLQVPTFDALATDAANHGASAPSWVMNSHTSSTPCGHKTAHEAVVSAATKGSLKDVLNDAVANFQVEQTAA